MGEEDTKRQALNVYKMRLLGARVHPVTTGTATLKDAVSETMREWTNRIDDTHYVLGSVMGPHPFPTIVRDFQAVISKESKSRSWRRKENFRTRCWPVSAAAPMRSERFTILSKRKTSGLSDVKRQARGIHTKETAATIATGKPRYLPRNESPISARMSTDRLLRYTPSQPDWTIRNRSGTRGSL